VSDKAILAASYLGPAGHGNDLTGIWPWGAPLSDALGRGELGELHWSLVFASDPGRFARMDYMSRLGLMAVELLEAGLDALPVRTRDRLGVCVETRAGSLSTDVRFLQTPRASLFAYTLPSTLIGEICIRYRLRGPVLCLMAPTRLGFASLDEACCWLDEGEADACLCLGCEAVEPETARAMDLETATSNWHACAALVGAPEGRPRERAMGSGTDSLLKTCLDLCGQRPTGVHPVGAELPTNAPGRDPLAKAALKATLPTANRD